MIDKQYLLSLLEKEIEFSRGCGMPLFTAGLLQAKELIQKVDESVKVGVGD